MGYHVSVFITGKGREIDFIAERDGRKYFVQVALSVAEEKAWQREMRPFEELSQVDRKILIMMDTIDYSTSNVMHLSMDRFLMLDSLAEVQ